MAAGELDEDESEDEDFDAGGKEAEDEGEPTDESEAESGDAEMIEEDRPKVHAWHAADAPLLHCAHMCCCCNHLTSQCARTSACVVQNTYGHEGSYIGLTYNYCGL